LFRSQISRDYGNRTASFSEAAASFSFWSNEEKAVAGTQLEDFNSRAAEIGNYLINLSGSRMWTVNWGLAPLNSRFKIAFTMFKAQICRLQPKNSPEFCL
jgi:hypothetical protein